MNPVETHKNSEKTSRAIRQRCRTLQTMPGVGPLTALAFVSAMDGPARFAKSSSVGAYLGLAPRGYQSGEVAWTGRISKTGDALVRALLYEAANSLMVRVKAWPPLKVWAHKLAERVGRQEGPCRPGAQDGGDLAPHARRWHGLSLAPQGGVEGKDITRVPRKGTHRPDRDEHGERSRKYGCRADQPSVTAWLGH